MEENNTQTQEPKKNNTMKAGIAIVGLIAIVIIAVFAFQAVGGENDSQTNQASGIEEAMTEDETMMEDGDSMMAEDASYQDGTYSAVGSYITPGGAQEVGVTLTISDGIIESSELDLLGTLAISEEKQADFAANYESFVIGKNIDEVELTKVSGSSLTPKGFNDALDQIKQEASS